jgi:SET domain-containing protein
LSPEEDRLFLKVSRSPLHGQGCFATREVARGEVVASNRLLVFPPEQMETLFSTRLKEYLFYLRDGPDPDGAYHTALAMGPISFCNHSADPNCEFLLDEAAGEIRLVARQSIRENEEVTIDYGDYADVIV